MIEFIVNNQRVLWTEIDYHYQKIPRPGGAVYRVKVSRNEHQMISHLESTVERSLDDPQFETDAEKLVLTSMNFIEYIIWKLRDIQKVKSEMPKWVFNNVRDVQVTDEEVLIEGDASPFTNDF